MPLAVVRTVWQETQQSVAFQSSYVIIDLSDPKRPWKTVHLQRCLCTPTFQGLGVGCPAGLWIITSMLASTEKYTGSPMGWKWGEPALRLAFVDLAGSERLPAEAWQRHSPDSAHCQLCLATLGTVWCSAVAFPTGWRSGGGWEPPHQFVVSRPKVKDDMALYAPLWSFTTFLGASSN